MPSNPKNDHGDNEEPIIRRREAPSRRRRDGLIRYANDNTSQNGEDGVIARIFELLPPPPSSSHRFCVDIGAWDGRHLSNTYSLLADNNNNALSCSWKGLLVEADPEKFKDLRALHKEHICVNAAVSIARKSDNRLETLIRTHGPDIPEHFDFLCIDIDGSDYWVLQGLLQNSTYRPKVICIEFNPTMPDDLIFIPSKNDTIRQGASLSALVELAEQWGYVLVETTLFNAFFVLQDLYQDYFKEEVPDTSIEALHEVTMGTSLYQLYDGTLKLWGCKKMLWHRMAIEEKKIQILPPERRHFPFAPSSNFNTKDAVDMGPICNDYLEATQQQKQACADALFKQLKKDGFAFVRGTGVSQTLCQEAIQATKAFLSDADENVRRSCLTKDRARRGYSPMCTENFASLIGEQGPNDLVKKWRMGPREESGGMTNASNSLLQPNVWPSSETWDETSASFFQTALEHYYDEACRVANGVVGAICDAIEREKPDLKEALEVFSKAQESPTHTSILTLLSYQVGTRHKGKNKGPLVAAHTDVGVITMLLFDGPGCAQLQRSDHAGGWVDVHLPYVVPKDPIFVVNIGDCLSEITGKMLPSTLHRVTAKSKIKDPRHCLALFMGLDPDTHLLVNGEEMPYEEWRKRRIARAQEVLKQASVAET